MYICRHVPSPTNPNGVYTIMEMTPEVIDSFLALVAKPDSQASADAALMTLTNGAELRSRMTPGVRWYRVDKPTVYTPTPELCQLTNKPLGSVMYDGCTQDGRWAIMSKLGWDLFGCGRLGTGFGQKYLRNEAGEFYISEGMSMAPRSIKVA